MGQGERTTEILVLIHTNVYSPFNVQARGGYVYFITFVDDYLWYNFMYLMYYKSKAFEKFIKFRHEVEK